MIFDDEIYLLKEGYFNLRTNIGERKTKRKKLRNEFIEYGGIEGFSKINSPHIALIIPSESRKDYSNFKIREIKPFIKYYENQSVDCNIYHCFKSEDFKKIIQSKKVIGIHIFGHGSMNALVFEDGLFSYRECQFFDKKEFVGQHHCNHKGKKQKSLAFLIGRKAYAPRGKSTIIDIYLDSEKLKRGKLWIKNNKIK
jgi:hypothetical protein